MERPAESQGSIHHQIKNFEFNFSSPRNKQTYHALDELDEVALKQMHGAGYLEMPGTEKRDESGAHKGDEDRRPIRQSGGKRIIDDQLDMRA